MPKKPTTKNHPSVLWFEILPPDAMGDIQLQPVNADYRIPFPIFLAKHKRHHPKTGDNVLARLTLLDDAGNIADDASDDGYYQAHILHLITPKTNERVIGSINRGSNKPDYGKRDYGNRDSKRADNRGDSKRNNNRGDDWYFQASIRAKNPLSFSVDKAWVKQHKLHDGALVSLTLSDSSAMEQNNTPIITDCKLLCGKDEAHALSYLTLAQFNIDIEFSEPVMAEADALTPFSDPTQNKRQDLTHLPFVTIDGADAKDFDDAVYAHDDGENMMLYVAIADVSHYVLPHSEIDKQAQIRGNSVYLPDMAVPMLPEMLSNNLCSLRPDELRPVMVAKIPILDNGTLGKGEFFRASIISQTRYTYEKAEELLQSSPPEHLKHLKKTYDLLAKNRDKRGAIDLERPEYKIHFNDDFMPTGIKSAERLESHKIIEEAMIAANVAVAQFLSQQMSDCVYRIHDAPPKDKAEELRLAALNYGMEMPNKMGIRSKDYQQLLQRARHEDFYAMLVEATLRSQSQAQYSRDNIGHFGLALEHYCHFTSPIRRYADLLVHRLLGYLIDGQTNDKHQPHITDEVCAHISATERVAQKCEYSCFDRYSALLMEEHIDKAVIGTITHISNAGLFIILDDYHCEGFLPARFLMPARHRNGGKSYGQRNYGASNNEDYLQENFPLKSKIDVRIIEADKLTGSITLKLDAKMPKKPFNKFGRKPSDDASAGKRFNGKRTSDRRSSDRRFDDRRTDDRRPSDRRSSDRRTDDDKPYDKKTGDKKTGDKKTGGKKTLKLDNKKTTNKNRTEKRKAKKIKKKLSSTHNLQQ